MTGSTQNVENTDESVLRDVSRWYSVFTNEYSGDMMSV